MIIKVDMFDFLAMHRMYAADIRDVLNRLGITWTRAENDPILDTAVFYGCAGIPDELPSYIKVMGETPTETNGS